MPKTSSIVLGGRFMGLFYGPNGGGKTIAAASWPGPVKIYDFDGRVAPVKHFYPNREDIDYITVGVGRSSTRRDVISFKEFTDEFEKLQDSCPYETVVIDSYTSFSACAIYYQMGINEEVKLTKGGLPIPSWDEFKGETGTMLQILEICKILPCNVIVTAHPVSRAQTTKSTGSSSDILASMVKATTLATYGWKTESFLPNYFNEMYYMHADAYSQVGQEPKRLCQTVASGEIVAKTALPLPPVMEYTGKQLYSVIQKHLDAHNLKLQEGKK